MIGRVRPCDMDIVQELLHIRGIFKFKTVHHLIDTLGTYEDAMSIAAAAANITGTPRIVKEKKRERFADYFFGSLASGLKEMKQEVLSRPMLQYSLTQP